MIDCKLAVCVLVASLAVVTTAACSSSAQPQSTVTVTESAATAPALSTTDPNGYLACTELATGLASDSSATKMNAMSAAAPAAQKSTTAAIRATYRPGVPDIDMKPFVDTSALQAACEAAGVPMPAAVQAPS